MTKTAPISAHRARGWRKWFSYRAEWVALLLVEALVWLFGQRRVIGALGALGAWIIHWPRVAGRAQANFDLVRPDYTRQQRRMILSNLARHFIALLLEYLDLRALATQPRQVQGREVLHRIAVSGRGAVFVTGHLGQWEVLRAAFKADGIDCAIFYRRFDNPYFEARAAHATTTTGNPAFHRDKHGIKQMLGHLRKGGSVLILVDQHMSNAPYLDFMGVPAKTSLGAAEMAARARLPLVPCVAFRTDAAFDVRIMPPLPCADPVAATQAVNAQLGHWIDEKPGQWLWFHRRWKRGVGRDTLLPGSVTPKA